MTSEVCGPRCQGNVGSVDRYLAGGRRGNRPTSGGPGVELVEQGGPARSRALDG